MAGKSIFAFGCSHASIVSQSCFTGRGFALINPIFNPPLMLDTRLATLTSKAERLPGFGREIRESPGKRRFAYYSLGIRQEPCGHRRRLEARKGAPMSWP